MMENLSALEKAGENVVKRLREFKIAVAESEGRFNRLEDRVWNWAAGIAFSILIAGGAITYVHTTTTHNNPPAYSAQEVRGRS